MNVYDSTDYKEFIKEKVRLLGTSKKKFSLRKLAEKIEIQYTYLSKCLNDESSHLNEDHLFRTCRWLELLPNEIDYLFLLRSWSASHDSQRKQFLFNKIERLQKENRISADVQDFRSNQLQSDINYLFNPYTVIVHVALHISPFQKNPRSLGAALNLPWEKVKETLIHLEQIGFIELEENRERVKRVKQSQLHYSTDHPLMRAHQTLLKQLIQAQLLKTSEEQKTSFLATFSADEKSFRKIQTCFRAFLKEVEQIARNADDEKVYQICFDLFSWM